MNIKLILAFFLFSFIGKSQNTVEIINANIVIGIDQLNATYYIKESTLYKKTDAQLFSYSNILFGEISSVDIINPSEIVVFYKNFNTIIILDTQLNQIDKVMFENKTIAFANKANSDRLWLFNTDSKKIELYNYRTEKTELMSKIVDGVFPKKMKSDFNNVWILTAKNEIIHFNELLVSEIVLEKDGILNFDCSLKTIAIQTTDNHFLLLQNNTTFPIKIKNKIVGSFFISNDKLYVFDENKIVSYKVPKID